MEKVTREPWKVSRADVDELRLVGFTDTAVLDACQIAGYYNFVNRLASGLGVELEEFWSREDFDPTT